MDMYEAAVGKVAVAEEEEGANSQNECLNVRRVLPYCQGAFVVCVVGVASMASPHRGYHGGDLVLSS
jgi:hypothetical protein